MSIKNTRLMFVIIVLISLAVPSLAVAQETGSPKTIEYTVVADAANLRSGPGTNYDIVATAYKGDSIFVYADSAETTGWLAVYRPGDTDAYIADFLVERAPTRFYPSDQDPVVTITGRGKNISDVIDLPKSAYRVDVSVADNSFILETVVVEGSCKDRTVFNELNFDSTHLVLSGLLVSSGCSLIFQTSNVDGDWNIQIRDLLDPDVFLAGLLEIEDGTTISGTGRALTMPTRLPEGIWTISAAVKDQAFIMMAQVLMGDCDDGAVFNELDFGATTLEASTVYRSEKDGCVIFWETENVDNSWTLTFEKLR